VLWIIHDKANVLETINACEALTGTGIGCIQAHVPIIVFGRRLIALNAGKVTLLGAKVAKITKLKHRSTQSRPKSELLFIEQIQVVQFLRKRHIA